MIMHYITRSFISSSRAYIRLGLCDCTWNYIESRFCNPHVVICLTKHHHHHHHQEVPGGQEILAIVMFSFLILFHVFYLLWLIHILNYWRLFCLIFRNVLNGRREISWKRCYRIFVIRIQADAMEIL
jgi:hypothetical protein